MRYVPVRPDESGVSSLATGSHAADEHFETIGRTVLVVEDEPSVRGVVERCLAQLGLTVTSAGTVAEARRLLAAGPVDLLVTDLGLPGESGVDLLRSLAADDRPATLVLTGVDDQEAVRSSLDLGAFAYLTKPPTLGGLQIAAVGALRQKDLENMHRSTIARLRDDVAQRVASEHAALQALEDSVSVLARAIESRDIVTGDHVDRMSSYCALIGAELGMPVEDQHTLALAARLHDVGTVAVPDRLLLKGGVLDEHELWVMQSHCQAGYEILSSSASPVLQLGAEIALTHHEWFDGCGYPRGLKGVDIPLVGRIAAIADVFDALTSERPYRAPLSPTAAIEVMTRERGTHFDPEILDLFLDSTQLRELDEVVLL
jgi:putative two-component system response regulator